MKNMNYMANNDEIKLVVTIAPYKQMRRATAEYKGKTFLALGASNIIALNKLFEDLSDNL